jgi:hypothetical protein
VRSSGGYVRAVLLISKSAHDELLLRCADNGAAANVSLSKAEATNQAAAVSEGSPTLLQAQGRCDFDQG